jgi:hypothetical protein
MCMNFCLYVPEHVHTKKTFLLFMFTCVLARLYLFTFCLCLRAVHIFVLPLSLSPSLSCTAILIIIEGRKTALHGFEYHFITGKNLKLTRDYYEKSSTIFLSLCDIFTHNLRTICVPLYK